MSAPFPDIGASANRPHLNEEMMLAFQSMS